jgi:ribosomal protein S18 acetylase RimI-like enzyme
MMVSFRIVPLDSTHHDWVVYLLRTNWGSEKAVSRGRVHDGPSLPGFVAVAEDGQPVGLALHRIEGESCELVVLDSLVEGQGIGSALIDAVRDVALKARCRRLWLITTNDNLHAIGFYQKRGFVLVAVHREALTESRRLKPEIPLIGYEGIPLRDEIELEINLA